jgi:hypothetical protein
MIYLAIHIPETCEEFHIRYEGHPTVEAAKAEMEEIFNRLVVDGKLPLPYYIYEADEPLYGNEAYHLDDIDFNFYRDPSEEEKKFIAETTKEIESAIETGDEEAILEAAQKAKEKAKARKAD